MSNQIFQQNQCSYHITIPSNNLKADECILGSNATKNNNSFLEEPCPCFANISMGLTDIKKLNNFNRLPEGTGLCEGNDFLYKK